MKNYRLRQLGDIRVELILPREESGNESKICFGHRCPVSSETCMDPTDCPTSARTIHAGAFCRCGDRDYDSEKIQKIAALALFGIGLVGLGWSRRKKA